MGMDFNVNVNVKTTGAEKIDALEAKIESLKTQPINLKVNVDNKNINTTNFANQMKTSYSNAGKSAGLAFTKNMESTISSTNINNLVNRLNTKGVSQNIVSGAEKSLNTLTKTGVQINKIREVFSNNKLTSLKIDGVDKLGNAVTVVDKLNQKTKEWNTTTSYNNVFKEVSKSFSQLDAVTASNKTLTWLKNNSKAAKDYGAVLTDLANKQRYATSPEELKSYTKQIQAIQAQAAALGKTGRSFADEIGRGFKKIGQFALTYGIIQRLAYQVPRAISQAVISIDDSVTQLKKVSDATDLQISSYFDEAAASAKKYGQTISDVIATTADWSRLGYSLEDSKLLSDITTLYQNVGDNMTQESASSSMISTLQGFQMQADEAMHIVDTYNEVGNRFAIGSDGIGEALQRSASSMYAANNSFEQTVGLVTAANTVVQDPDSVGTAFKTKFLRNCLYVQKCA